MIYDWREDSFEEIPFLEWRQVDANCYQTIIKKNGRKYRAELLSRTSSWKLKLTQVDKNITMLELRFRNVTQDDAMSKAEFYILEYII